MQFISKKKKNKQKLHDNDIAFQTDSSEMLCNDADLSNKYVKKKEEPFQNYCFLCHETEWGR